MLPKIVIQIVIIIIKQKYNNDFKENIHITYTIKDINNDKNTYSNKDSNKDSNKSCPAKWKNVAKQWISLS